MADVTESVAPDSQILEQPNPKISEIEGEQSLGQAGGESVDLSEIKDFIRKEVQSVKDVRFGKHGTRLDNLEDALSQYQSLIDSGMSSSEAQAKMQGDGRLAQLEQELASLKQGVTQPASEGSVAQTWEEQQQAILSKHGLENGDTRAVELAKSKTWSSYDEYLKALEQQANEWSFSDSTKPQPNTSTVAQTTTAAVPSEGDYPGLTSEQLGDRAMELSKNFTANAAEISKIDKELARRDKIGDK